MIKITAISLKTGKNHFNSTYILHILTKLLTKTNFYEKAILIRSLHIVRCIRIVDDLVPAGRGTHRKRPDRSGRPDDPRGNARQLLPRCLVEVNDVNPLNAGEYLLSDGTPFFTHVILFASNIRGDASGNVHNYNNPNNAAILANPAKYIAPLQAKGIKVIMGNLGDHTGAGFANLTAAQIGTYTDDLVAYDNIVDGYDFDDEWAEYGTRGYPNANSTSYSNMIIALAGKTNKSISVFDWGNTGTLSSTAISHLDWGCQGSLNGYGFNSSFAAGKYLPLFVNLTSPLSDTAIRSRTTQAKNADARGICFFNLPMSPYRLSSLNAAAQAFGETVSHTGKTYSKDYGN